MTGCRPVAFRHTEGTRLQMDGCGRTGGGRVNIRLLYSYFATFLAVSVLTLSGCTNEDPHPRPSSITTAATTTSGTVTTSPNSLTTTAPAPTTTKPSGDPSIPAAARANSSEGAQSFTSYFLAQINDGYARLDTGFLDRLATQSCKTCGLMRQTLNGYSSASHKYVGAFVKPTYVTTASFTPDATKVFVAEDTPPRTVVNSSGKTIQTFPAEKGNYSLTLIRVRDSWRVNEIQVAS